MLATFPFEKKTLKFVTGKYKSRSRTEKLCEEAALLHAPNFEMYQPFNTELEKHQNLKKKSTWRLKNFEFAEDHAPCMDIVKM